MKSKGTVQKGQNLAESKKRVSTARKVVFTVIGLFFGIIFYAGMLKAFFGFCNQ